MGCLCPRKTQYVPPIYNQSKKQTYSQSVSQQNFIDSERHKIIQPIQYYQNPQKKILLTSNNQKYLSQKLFENKDNSELRTGMGLVKSQILVSQIGGSKLERSISILSTQADFKSLESSLSSNHSIIQDMIVVSNVFKAKDKLRKIKKQYYSLIQNKLYVKKDSRSQIKIKTISNQSTLFCNFQTVRETIHLTLGVPIQNIKIVTTQPLTYLVENNLDLIVNLKLQCLRCNLFRFRTSSSCKIVLDFICKCSSNQFSIQTIKTQPFNFPIWYQGQKIILGNVPYLTGSEFRVVGCNICWKFQNTESMQCGCLRCSNCKWQHQNSKCVLCV